MWIWLGDIAHRVCGTAGPASVTTQRRVDKSSKGHSCVVNSYC